MSKKYFQKNLVVGGNFLSRSGTHHKEKDRFHYIKNCMMKTFDKVKISMARQEKILIVCNGQN